MESEISKINNNTSNNRNNQKNNELAQKEKLKTLANGYREINIKKEHKVDKDLQNIYLFSFDNFSTFYQNNLRFIINREQEDDKENFSKVKSNNRLYKNYKRNNFFLSKNILTTYITFKNNNLKKLLKAFELIKCEYKEEEKDLELNSSLIINNNISSNIEIKQNLKEEIISVDSQDNKDDLNDIQEEDKNDDSLKKQFFGTYDEINFSEVIEYYFITEKFFSSYTLIKFSLLNILAVTRLIESKIINNLNVIQIICDFCDITQLEVKKYMNIFLNIFKEIYQKQDKNLKKKFEIEECIKKIFIYIKNKKMILTEENEKFLNYFKKIMKNLEEKSSITESENFINFVNEKGKMFPIIKKLFSSNIKDFEISLKNIESINLGKYKSDFFNFDYEEINDLFKESKKENSINDKHNFIPKTPILLYDSTSKILKKYLTNISNENIPFNKLYNDILSLLFYFKIPIIEEKWLEGIEEQIKYKNNKNKKDEKNKKEEKNKKDEKKKKDEKNKKDGKKKKEEKKKKYEKNIKDKNSINSESKNNEESDYTIINKINSDWNNSELFEVEKMKNKPDLESMLKKIIAILYDLVNIIKKNNNVLNNINT